MTKNLGDTFSIVRHGDSRLADIRDPGIRTHSIRRDDGGVSALSAGGTRRGQPTQHRSTILLNLALAPLIWEAVTRINLFRRWQQEEVAGRDIHPEVNLDRFRLKQTEAEDSAAEQTVLAQANGESAPSTTQPSVDEQPEETAGETAREAAQAPRISSAGRSQASQNNPAFSNLTTNEVEIKDFQSSGGVSSGGFTSTPNFAGRTGPTAVDPADFVQDEPATGAEPVATVSLSPPPLNSAPLAINASSRLSKVWLNRLFFFEAGPAFLP